ncbi:flagellar biosynthesis repressor FlbT [Methylorubrum thiocyanatum]|uniref:flagellar biosynthesis repressor FlbT n=1 Tax=Methylorubrum thiocyanatum TaxID=47958 RepID=UPI00398C4235
MPLRITLKPFERLIINGALIKNGSRNSNFLIENQCKFLREGEIIHESEADTPCKKLCVTLQVLHLSEDPAEVENLFFHQAVDIMKMMPSAAPFMSVIQNALAEQNTHAAIKAGKQLVYHERDLLASRSDETAAA